MKQKIANIDDINNGEMKEVLINELSYLVAKVENTIYVTSNMCTHEDAELSMGCLNGTKVKCPLHGSYFDLLTGKALNEPAEDPIKVYKCVIEDGEIFLDE
jgi:3-phenylpropionate/trans-cinnamate dioxygenase ferredoxin subunit|tara:strand:- start:1131 stop:1433 length:303 start_codon:yes stop_codon:yes gene_type:complete